MKLFSKIALSIVAAFLVQILLVFLAPAYPFIGDFITTPAGYFIVLFMVFWEMNFATL